MLSKSYNLTAIMDLPLSAVLGYLDYAIKQERDQYAWELWKTMYPNMMAGFNKFISFDEFKGKLFNPQLKYSKKSKQEIMSEMMEVVKAYKGR